MGNILSNTSNLTGNSKGVLGLAGGVKDKDGNTNAFVQNITDILLELDLLNRGNYDINADEAQQGPRSEFNYSYNAYNTNPTVGTKSPDVYNHIGRPKNSAGQYIDFQGIPYATTETPLRGVDNSKSSIGEPGYKKALYNSVQNNSFYNMKRAVCNKTPNVPISLVGVDLPADDPDFIEYADKINKNKTYAENILNNQKNEAYRFPANADKNSPNAVSKMVDNCLTYGTITSSETTKPAIPDLTPASGLLNKYSNTEYKSGSVTTKPTNIYDKEISPDCVNLLNSMLTNSFTTPNLNNYSKWSPTDRENIAGIASGATQLIHDYARNKVGLIKGLQGQNTITATDSRIPAGFNGPTVNLFGQGENGTNASGATSAQADMNQTCQDFQQDLCSWYYYYDVMDAIRANNNLPMKANNQGKFSNNMQFLSSHIPDCRCEAFNNAGGKIDAKKATGSAYMNFYQGNKCNANFNYGQGVDDNGSSYPTSVFSLSGTTDTSGQSLSNVPTNLYNSVTDKPDTTGFRRQFDPIGVQLPGTTDKIWGIVRDKQRISATTVSNYVCNMNLAINVGDTGGNVVVGGVNMSCGLPQACEGQWVDAPNAVCNAACNADGSAGKGTITQIYQITSPAANGGAACEKKPGDTQIAPCTGNSCPPVPCQGTWSANWSACTGGCNQSGIQTKNWTTTVAAKFGGSCPSGPQIQDCNGVCPPAKVDCEGKWTTTSACVAPACGQPGSIIQTYTVTTNKANGGASCPADTGDTRSQVCAAVPCAAVNCVGNWETSPGATCNGVCGTNGGAGTINQTWKTITPASNGGSACPSATRNEACTTTCAAASGGGTVSGGDVSTGASGAAAAAAAAAASASGNGSSSNIDPTFSGLFLSNSSLTSPKYDIPLEATTPILMPFSKLSAQMVVNTAIVYTFTTNYQFVLFLDSDVSKVVVCPNYNGSTCPNTTGGASVAGTCSPYIVTLPFIYGTTTTSAKYQLGVRNKPGNYTNTIKPAYFKIPLTIKQYSMNIASATITIVSERPFLAIKINQNTTDTISGLGIRIILTPVSGSSPVLTKYYSDLQSSLKSNNNVLTIGGSTNVIEPIAYNYKVMLNETVINGSPVTYSDGYPMNYDQSFPVASQGVVDFGNISSAFNSVSLQYMDYTIDNVILNVAPNDTLLIGSTLLFSTVFNNTNTSITAIKIYYDTNPNYTPSTTASSTSVLIKTSGLGDIDNSTNNYSNTIDFICPFLETSQPIIFYAVATGGSKNVYSTAIKISLPKVSSSPSINNWKIIQNSTSPDMATLPTNSLTPVITTGQSIPSVNNYFNAGKTFKYVIYNKDNSLWYGSNATPVAVSGTSSSAPTYTIFQNPYTATPQPSIIITSIKSVGTNSNTSIYSSSTSGSITLELGAELTLNYQITNITIDTYIQLIIANKTIISFPFNVGASSTGAITFTVFGDLTVVNPKLLLTSFGTWNSSAIPIVLNNLGAIKKTLSAGSATPASSVIFTTINNPAINIVAPNNDSVILSMNASYDVMGENQYFTQLSRFATPLTVKNASFTFAKMDFALPFSLIFYSSPKEGFNNVEKFTNARELYLESKKSKKHFSNNIKTSIDSNIIEPFYEHLTSANRITIDTLTLDFSLSTLDTVTDVQLMFSGYTDVTVTNLILVFGTLSLDNKKFNVNITSDSVTKTTFSIPNITFIGTLSTNLFLVSTVPGLSTVNYSVNKMINNNYALILPLVFSNGSYSLPETYQAQLTTVLKPAVSQDVQAKPVVPVITQAPEPSTDLLKGLELATGLSSTVLMSIAGAIILLILYLIYTTFIKAPASKK